MTDRSKLLASAAKTDAASPAGDGVPGIDFLPACAVEALTSEPVLAAMCRDCAFRPGTDAHSNIVTRITAAGCVEASHPFWCHKATDQRGDVTHICAGWANAIVERAEALS